MNPAFHFRKFLESTSERLKKVPASPRAVAGGVAVGMFWAFTPLLGLKTALAVLSAWLLRSSKVAAALAVSIHDLLTPIWPLFLRWEYDLGFWLIHHRLPHRFTVHGFHVKDWLQWNTLRILWPTFLGSMFFAVPSALLSYWIVVQSLRRYEGHRQAKQAEEEATQI